MLWEVSGGKSRFKVDVRKDFSLKEMRLHLGLERKMEFRWNVRKEEVIHKPERTKNALLRHREHRKLCDGFQD